MARTITAANAVFFLGIAGVFPTPVQLQQWGVDEAFDTDAVDAAETQVGVDGAGVAGWVPREYPMSLTFLATSLSNDLFDQWAAAQDTVQDILYASGTIRVSSIGKQLSMSQGVLKRYTPLGNVKKVLANRVYGLVWQPQPGIPAILVSPI